MSTIPDDAIEAAAFIRYKQDHWGKPTRWPTREELGEGKAIFDDAVTLDGLKADYIREATEILAAATPFISAQALTDAADRLDQVGDGFLDVGLTTYWFRRRADRIAGK